MSKKKPADKRLDKLFKNITPEESAKPKRGKKAEAQESLGAAEQAPAKSEALHTRPLAASPLDVVRQPVRNESTISLAFQAGQNSWATLQVLDEVQGQPWSPDDELLVRQVADQLSLALEKAQLFQETQSRAEEMAVLNEVGKALTAALSIDQITEITYNGIARLFNAKNFYIAFYDEEKQEVVFPHNVTESVVDSSITRLPVGKGITSHMIRTRESILIRDGSDKWMRARGEEPVGDSAKSFLGVPLVLGDKVLGAMAIQDYKAFNKYDEHDLRLLTSFASQTAIAVENARLFEETQRRTRETTALAEVGREISSALTLDEVLGKINTYAYDLLQATSAAAYLPIEGGAHWQAISALGLDAKEIKADLIVREEGLLGRVITQQAGSIINNVFSVPGAIVIAGTEGHIDPHEHLMATPVLSGNRVTGLLAVWRNGEGREFTKVELNFLTSLALQTAVAIENARLFEETQRRAEETARLNRLVTKLSETLDLKKNLQTIADEIANVTSALHVGLALIDKEKNDLVVMADSPLLDGQNAIGIHLPIAGNPTAETVIANREPLFINDALNNPLTINIKDILTQRNTQSLFIWPVIAGKELIGTVGLDFPDPQHKLPPEQKSLIETILSQVQTVVQNSILIEETQKSEAELRALFSAMPDVVLIVDKETRYVRIAPTNPSLLFRPPDELVGKRMVDIMPPEIHLPFKDAIEKTLDTGQVNQIEYELPIEGRSFWFLANLSKLNENEVFWIARDITERKHAEEALQRRSNYLAASAEIGRLVTSTLDLNTIFTRTVRLISDRFGFYYASMYSVEETGFNAILREATGEAGEKMKARNHSVTVGAQTIVGKVAETGKSIVVDDILAEPNFQPNSLLPESRAVVGIPLRVGQRTVGVIDIQSKQIAAFTQDDISVLQSLADQVAVAIDNARSYELSQQLIKDLREVDKLKSQFLANMSHELRTPLNSIIGFSRVILKGIDGPVTDMQQQDLTAIYNSGQHLLGLINDILDLARIEAGKMELNFEEVQLNDMATSVLATAKGLVKEKPIQLIAKIPDKMGTIRGDTMRVRQIFINLLSNASKFTEEGSITVEASTQKSATGKLEALIRVTDTGPGISLPDQEKLFKAFSQVDGSATRKSGGSGLGLSICANLVQLHGGRIGVESEEGKGSTFWFTLPLYNQPVSEIPAGKKVVLAIDDDPQVVSLYERYLNPQGYFVIPLTDPSKAREQIIELKPHAVTLDIMMPKTDGWALLTTLKSDPATRDIPIIVCSILEQADKGFNLGAADYLIKPILEEDLVQAIDRLNHDGHIHEVLVIDDDTNDLRLIEKILTQHGHYRPILAEGGRKGWEAITQKAPDAILLDIFMPEMDGFSILERLQENPALREIPVLVVSGGGLTNEQQAQLREYGKRLITKGSLHEEELITSIEHALKRVEK